MTDKQNMERKNSENGTEDERLLATSAGKSFTRSEPWRVLRIQGEFVEGFEALAELGPAVTIFGSARTKADDPMYEKAVELSRRIGEEGYAIITGGGPGIMEAGNKGAEQAGVESVGLNIELPFEQHNNPYVSLSVNFRYFFARKTMFVKYAQAFVIFPGGFGTMDELFESLCLIQTGKVKDFPVVLFGKDYWGGLIQWLSTSMLDKGNICADDLDLLMLTDSIDEAVDFVSQKDKVKNLRQSSEEGARKVAREVYSRKERRHP